MSYKTIVVHLDASPRCAERTMIAARLALDFEAHLKGVYAATATRLPSYIRAEGDPQLTEEWRRIHREWAAEAAARFRAQSASAGVPGAEVHVVQSDPVGAVALHARYADLLVVGQDDPDEDQALLGAPADFAAQALQAVVRPVLMVPYTGSFPSLGARVLIAWNASRAAARAVTDALPFLKRAARVTVLVVNPEATGDHGEVPGADLALYLSRHGVNVEAAAGYSRDVDPGSWLVSRAFDLGADLMVMGGYGHSYLREAVFGGVTRSVLGQLTIPALIEH